MSHTRPRIRPEAPRGFATPLDAFRADRPKVAAQAVVEVDSVQI
jgi:hypothetical protein